MKLESLGGKPLDYIEDESGEKRGIYQDGSGDNEEELISADDFVGVLDVELDELYRDSGLEEYSGRDIGAFSIGAPTVDKKRAEEQSEEEEQLTPEELASAKAINDEFAEMADKMLADLEALFGNGRD